MMKIEFSGSAAEVLAEMQMLVGARPLPPTVQEEAFRVAPAPAPVEIDGFEAFETVKREPELPGLSVVKSTGAFVPPKEGENAPSVQGPAAELAPQRKRRTKAEMEAARAAEPPKEPLPPAEVRPTTEAEKLADPEGPITFEDCKEALKDICEADGLGVEAAQALLKQFGVSRLSLLDASRWSEFHESARHLVEPLV